MNLPIINTGDWNTSGASWHHAMTNFEDQGIVDSGAGGPTFPSQGPVDWDDRILAANVFELAADVNNNPNPNASDHTAISVHFKI